MQLENGFTVPVPVDEAWKAFLDLERVAPCMPGAVLDTLEGDTFTGRVKVKVGAVQLSYKGEGTVRRDEAARTVVLDLSGAETRGSGTANAMVTAVLTADPVGTRVRVSTDLDITGKPAQFGRGIMTEVGDKIVKQFATRLAEMLASGSAGAGTGASAEASSASGAAAERGEKTKQAKLTEQAEPEALDLGSAVLPVLAKKAAAPAAALVVLLLLLRLLRRPGK